MYCRSCGCKLEPEARFCRSCGAPAPEPQPVQPVVQILTPEQPAEQTARKPSGGWGKFFFGLLAGVLCCAIAVGVFALCRKGGAETKLEGSGFDSPEAAMQAYLDGLLNGDAEKAISSFAIETFTAHFDWKTYAERRSMYLPNSYSPDWFGAEQVNLAVRFRDAAGALYTQYRLIALADTPYDMQDGIDAVHFDSADDLENFTREFADDDIRSNMHVEEIMCAEEYPDADFQERYASEANTKNREGLRKECGADELCTVFASLSFDGEQYWFAMETACYDGVWYNLSLNGNGGALLGLPAYGIGIVE